jgi:hypothetical protein
MLRLLARRCLTVLPHSTARLRTHQASALTVSPAADTDLIVTHFFLDCLTQTEVDQITTRLAAVSPGTLWLLSDFGPPRPAILKPFAAIYIRALYLAFRILTGLRTHRLPNPQAALASAGFIRIAHHDLLFGLVYTELWQRQ